MTEHKTRWEKKVEKRPELAELRGATLEEVHNTPVKETSQDQHDGEKVDPHADVPDRQGLLERHEKIAEDEPKMHVDEPVQEKQEDETPSNTEDEADLPEGLEEEGAGWYTASDGEKIRGEKKAIDYQNKLNENGDV